MNTTFLDAKGVSPIQAQARKKKHAFTGGRFSGRPNMNDLESGHTY
jgi:hypothetical protein